MCTNKSKYVIIPLIAIICVAYLQYGRDMDIYNSSIFSVGTYNEAHIKVLTNTLYISDKKKCAEEILKKCKDNSFLSVDFCYDTYIPNIITAGMADNIIFMLTEFFDTAKVGLQL